MSSSPVCLIIPPSAFLLDERVFMTLGILKVAAVLEAQGVRVELLDLSGIANYADAVRDHARVSSANVYGLTATTPQLPAATEIVKVLRETRPQARLILGGPHITLVHAAAKKERAAGREGRALIALAMLEGLFDVLVAGDGEEAISVAIADGAKGVIDADDPKSPLFLDNQRLTQLPFPARHLIDLDSYRYSIDGVPALSIIAQLGCPFACGFCGGRESPMLRRVRMRTSENIVEEMVHLHQTTGRRGFMLYDDELNVNKKMIELMQQIAAAQKKLGVRWHLRGFVKSELFTDEQAEAMREAGFLWILTGFESGSPRILQNINKKATQDENTRCIDIARRHGLKVKALMSVGHPGESFETLNATKQWLIDTRPADFDVSIITCYPGTPYYDQAVPHTRAGEWVYTHPKNGDRLYQLEVDYTRVANYYKGDPDAGYCSYVYTDELSPTVLVAERDKLERELRQTLGIPFNASAASVRYEHSMGQMGKLPANILRSTSEA